MKQKEFYDLADEMERECGDWENSEGMSESALSELIAKVEKMDREASERAKNEKERPAKTRRFRLKKRYIVVLAAALVLVMVMGTGVVGDRAWIAESNDLERESEVSTKVNNEEKNSILREEEEIYQEIADKLGIAPMRLAYIPKGMILDSYTVLKNTGWAYVNYLYNDKLISVKMAKENSETSSNIQWDGESRKIENVKNEFGYEIEAYCVDEEHQNYSASLNYGNGYYNILGCFPSEEQFLEILNGIYFKTL